VENDLDEILNVFYRQPETRQLIIKKRIISKYFIAGIGSNHG